MRLVHFIGVLRAYQDKPSGYMIALIVLSLALGFRELQHRTANNLQNVSALLRQNREAIGRDPSKATAVIDSAERRLEIMSRINRRLYSPELQGVEAAPFLEVLCQDILASMGNDNVSGAFG
jgi:two-component sensor histidine kinase